jgi:DNA-binding PadR family transcriptional regulator
MSPKRRLATTESQARTNLELFVLAAVRGGLDSAYDLHKSADLSVGATLPLLRRLEKDGLLRSKPAARRSKQYSLTSVGQSVLQHSWRKLLTPIPREFDAILRIAYVAAVMEALIKTTQLFLKSASAERRQLAAKRKQQADLILHEVGQHVFGQGHRWLRAHSDSIRLEAEASVLSRLAVRKDLSNILRPRHS